MFVVGRYVLLNMYLAVILASFAMIQATKQMSSNTLLVVKEEAKSEIAKANFKCAIAKVAALKVGAVRPPSVTSVTSVTSVASVASVASVTRWEPCALHPSSLGN